MNITIEKVNEYRRLILDTKSLNDFVKDEEDGELENFVPTDIESPEDTVINLEWQKDFRVLLEQCNLTEPELTVIKKRYGVENEKIYTLKEISQEFGVSIGKIRQIEAKALRKLKHPVISRKFAKFLDDPDNAFKQYNIIADGKKESVLNNNQVIKILDYYRSENQEKKAKKSNKRSGERNALLIENIGEQENTIVNTIGHAFDYSSTTQQYASVTSTIECKKENTKRVFQKLNSVYDLYSGKYSKEEMDIAISKLNEVDQHVLKVRFGENFINPVSLSEIDQKITTRFSNTTVIQLYKFLSDPNYVATTDYMQETLEGQSCNHPSILNINNDKPKEKNKMSRKRTESIYDQYDKYTEEEINAAIAKLNEDDLRVFRNRWGEDGKTPTKILEMPQKDRNKYYQVTIPNIERFLKDSNNQDRRKNEENSKQQNKSIQENTKSNRNNKRRNKTSYYTYFSEYDKEILDKVLVELGLSTRNKIYEIWGEDLMSFDEKHFSFKLKNALSSLVSMQVREKANAIIENADKKEAENTIATTANLKDQVSKQTSFADLENKRNNIEENTAKEKQVTTQNQNLEIHEITKEDYIALADMFAIDDFKDLMENIGDKEAFIVSLKLGRFSKYYSNEAIANFLEIPEEEVITTTKTVLYQYKMEIINSLSEKIDQAIDVITDSKLKIKSSKGE